MPKVNFKGSISPAAIKAFRDNYKLLTEKAKNSIFLGKKQSFAKERERLRRRKIRRDPLFRLLRSWAKAERTPMKYIHLEYEGERLYTERITDIPRYRSELSYAIKSITALIAYKNTVNELVSLGVQGDEDSLFKLIMLDKIFLTAKFAQDWFLLAQGKEDRRFFRVLSNALRHDTFREHIDTAKIGIACYLLWYLGSRKKRLTRDDLLKFLEEEGIARYPDLEPFYKMLNAIGLVRYRINHKKSRKK